MKKTYLKPDMQVVQLQHQLQLLAGSGPRSVSTNLGDDDDLDIDDTPAGTGFWGR